jgi:hypothetical protein
LADVAELPAPVSAVGEALSIYQLQRKELQTKQSRGICPIDANEFWLHMCLASECHHGLQDVGCAQKRSATRRASSDTIEQPPRQGCGLHLCGRALRGALQRVSMISTYESTRIIVLVTVEAVTVPGHVKFHIRHRWQGTPESVVEKSHLALRWKVPVTDHGAKSGRVTHQGSPM